MFFIVNHRIDEIQAYALPLFSEMPELTSMGELASEPPEEENSAFVAIVASLDANFPEGWRDWAVYNFTFEELFVGDQVPQSIEVKLRFAIPTVDMARAFDPAANSLSARSYRKIRMKLLKWSLGRALLYSPHSLMEKIHAPSFNIFKDAVIRLKPLFVKRSAVSCELGGKEGKRASSGDPSQPKRFAPTPSSSIGFPSPRTIPSQGSSDHLLAAVLSQQTELFSKLLNMQSEQNENVKLLLQHRMATPQPATSTQGVDLDGSFESLPDSTNSEEENTVNTPSACDINTSTKEAYLRAKISDAQKELSSLQAKRNEPFDFSPITTIADPKTAVTDPNFLKQGIQCQQFGQEGWRNIRYGETQKQFQASPAFCALRVNNLLAGVSPTSKASSVLERFDLTLGAITHGLLQQREAFQGLLDQLPQEMREKIGAKFLNSDSRFKNNSDALLQYVCGRRAEVIEQRRDAFKVPNRALNEILHGIPPSETNLFSDQALSKAIKDCSNSDVRKFFPYLNRKKSNSFQAGEKQRGTRLQQLSQSDGRRLSNQRIGGRASRTATKQHHYKLQSQKQSQNKQVKETSFDSEPEFHR